MGVTNRSNHEMIVHVVKRPFNVPRNKYYNCISRDLLSDDLNLLF